jgi:hypothetical protein
MRLYLTYHQFADHTRILLDDFLRKRFVGHIFNSKMEKIPVHLKYIARWKQMLKNPEDFRAISYQ